MTHSRLLDFCDAIDEVDDKGDEVAVLLGNGFSIDYDRAMFDYKSLSQRVDLENLSVSAEDLFDTIDSHDFEKLIDYLSTASDFIRLYGGSEESRKRFLADADGVRSGLAAALASNLPENTYEMELSHVESARSFLGGFDQIFTLNYDPLLYWVVNWTEVAPDVCREDGFRRRDGELAWAPNNEQLVHYLHGALHLYEEDGALRKVSYSKNSPIVSTIRKRLSEKKLPLVVTEGRRAQKETRIAKSQYLTTALRRFGRLEGALFLHGVSMGENDEHVFSKIESSASRITALYVSNVGKSVKRGIADRVEAMIENRKEAGGAPLTASFYDAASAEVWRPRVRAA